MSALPFTTSEQTFRSEGTTCAARVYRPAGDVTARVALKVGLYSPARHAARVTCPALVQIAAHDAVTPRRVAEKAAAKMLQSTVHVYDCGHFDPYVEPFFGQVVSDQLSFLRAQVPVKG